MCMCVYNCLQCTCACLLSVLIMQLSCVLMYVCMSEYIILWINKEILIIANDATKASYIHVLWLFIGYSVSVVEQSVE